MRTLTIGVSFTCMLLFCLVSHVSGTSHGYGDIIVAPETQRSLTLEERWNWAQKTSESAKSGCWIGYSIELLMNPNSWIGSNSHNEPSLHEMIKNIDGTMRSSASSHTGDRSAEKVPKDIAILLYVPGEMTDIKDVTDIKVNDIALYVDLLGKPLIWLGETVQEESYEFLASAYNQIISDKTKEDLISVIGLHQECPAVIPFLENIITVRADDDIREEAVFWLALQEDHDVTPFLSNIILNDTSVNVRKQAVFAVSLIKSENAREVLFNAARSNDDRDVREQAIFWLAQADTPDVLTYLIEIINTDPSEHVRKEAVFGLSRMKTEGALDTLIEVARSSENAEVQKQAIFWLGQIASLKSVEALTEITYDNASSDMQRQAVFALSQLKHQDSIPELIHIANEHPDREVRKQAVFWLGQSGDPRALEAIIEIIQD